MTTTRLLTLPDEQRRAFADACAWADQILMCVGWLEGGDDLGPSWDVLEPHLARVRGAYVGFGFMRSEASLLRALYERGVLHVVSSTDGGFSPNTYLFLRDTEARVIVASAPFSRTSHEDSIEAAVFFEGTRSDSFVLEALSLVERCRAVAHVPTLEELDEYRTEQRNALARIRKIETTPLSGRMSLFEPVDLEGLAVVTEREDVRRAMALLVAAFERACSWEGDLYVRVKRTRGVVWAHSVEALSLWGAFYRGDDLLTAAFGAAGPEADLELTFAPEGFDRKLTGVFLAREGHPNVYLGVRGLKEGRAILQPDNLFSYLPTARAAEQGREARTLIVGDLTSPSFVPCAAAFVHRWRERMELL